MKFITAVVIMFGLGVVALLTMAVTIYAQQSVIESLSDRVVDLENDLGRAKSHHSQLRLAVDDQGKLLEDFQQWRVNVTLASRMGWHQAARYVRQYPLELPEKYQ